MFECRLVSIKFVVGFDSLLFFGEMFCARINLYTHYTFDVRANRISGDPVFICATVNFKRKRLDVEREKRQVHWKEENEKRMK